MLPNYTSAYLLTVLYPQVTSPQIKKKKSRYLKENAKLESPLSTRRLNTAYKMLSRMTVPAVHM